MHVAIVPSGGAQVAVYPVRHVLVVLDLENLLDYIPITAWILVDAPA